MNWHKIQQIEHTPALVLYVKMFRAIGSFKQPPEHKGMHNYLFIFKQFTCTTVLFSCVRALLLGESWTVRYGKQNNVYG